MFSLIGSALIGLVVGVLAKLIMPGRDPGGCLVTMLLGMGGAVVMTFIGQALGFYRVGQRAGFLGALVGALLILWIYRMIIEKRR